MPTATVHRMSRTAKRPSGANSPYASKHMGLVGVSATMAASPVFTEFGGKQPFYPYGH